MKRPPETPARSADSVIRNQTDALAADWLARREAGLSPDEQAEFSRWLLECVDHEQSVARIEATRQRLQRPQLTGQADAVIAAIQARVAGRERTQRRWLTVMAGGCLAAAAAIALAMLPAHVTPPQAQLEPAGKIVSVAVKPERKTLPDGSVVELNARAEIEVNFTSKLREVRLVHGEAHFDVEGNPDWPFVVTAGHVQVRAIGTAFNVRFASSEIDVLVTEGRVVVERPRPSAPIVNEAPNQVATEPASPGFSETVFVVAGEQVSVPVTVPSADPLAPRVMAAEEVKSALAWREKRVEFTATLLGDAVDLFNRHNALKLELADRELAQIRVSGIFWSDDPEGFSRLLGPSADLRATRVSEGTIRLQR
jgi:transmembrane sensor